MIKADINDILEKHDNRKSSLIAILQDIQLIDGWLPQEILRYVSEELDVSLMDLYSIVTFYKSFCLHPRGKHIITMCLGTACHVRGAPNLLNYVENRLNINDGETTPDNQFTLETVRCLGACAIAPVIMIDGKAHGRMTQRTMNRLLTRLKQEDKKVQDIEEEGN